MGEPMRYVADVDNGTLYLRNERNQDGLKIGSMDDIVDLVGGETYTLEYGSRQAAVSWLSTDEDNTVTFEVRNTLADWSYTREFVERVGECSLETTDENGYPVRTAVFADMVVAIWDSKGNIES